MLTAVLDEAQTGGQAITAAEYFVDVPPWSGGVAQPLRAADGALDSMHETVTGTVDVAFGRHLVYVRGQDADGSWGPVRAAWIDGGPAAERLWVPIAAN
jgi:hypothetical protein